MRRVTSHRATHRFQRAGAPAARPVRASASCACRVSSYTPWRTRSSPARALAVGSRPSRAASSRTVRAWRSSAAQNATGMSTRNGPPTRDPSDTTVRRPRATTRARSSASVALGWFRRSEAIASGTAGPMRRTAKSARSSGRCPGSVTTDASSERSGRAPCGNPQCSASPGAAQIVSIMNDPIRTNNYISSLSSRPLKLSARIEPGDSQRRGTPQTPVSRGAPPRSRSSSARPGRRI